MADEALGTLIGEEHGQTVGFRVLTGEGPEPRMEVSVRSSGRVFGVESNSVVTYTQTLRPGGILYGEGQGMGFLKDGSTGEFHGSGVGVQKGPGGAAHYRAVLYYRNATGKLERLNNRPVLVEFDVAEDWTTHSKIYEWR